MNEEIYKIARSEWKTIILKERDRNDSVFLILFYFCCKILCWRIKTIINHIGKPISMEKIWTQYKFYKHKVIFPKLKVL